MCLLVTFRDQMWPPGHHFNPLFSQSQVNKHLVRVFNVSFPEDVYSPEGDRRGPNLTSEFLMSIIAMCSSNIYTHKISVKTQHLYSIPTNSGLHVSTPPSHHQALLGTSPRTSKLLCTLGSQVLTKVVWYMVKVHINGCNVQPYRQEIREIYNRCMELSHVLCVKIVHLVHRAALFKVSSLVYGGREIVLNV
jgi:hypothetical protein